MKSRNLESRIKRLEAKRQMLIAEVHRLILSEGESEAEARTRYKLTSGRTIGPSDLVILRVIAG